MADRILTTHVGSLPRPERVVTQLFAQDSGLNYDAAQFDAVMQSEVGDVVARQVQAQVDVVSDGEMSKISYATYIRHRLTGFELGEMPRAVPLDLDDFPEFKERLAKLGATPKYHRPICTGPIAVKDLSALHQDIANLKAACAKAAQPGQAPVRGFMNSASPGVIAVFQPNQYYPAGSSTCRRWPTRWPANTRPSSPPGSTCRSTRPTWPWAGTSSSATSTMPSSCATRACRSRR
jgi:5-methyltetrahydropteroyltriglutamate--homocysteine methyltransferase